VDPPTATPSVRSRTSGYSKGTGELGDFAGGLSVGREAVSLYAALLSLDAALYGDAFEGAIHSLVIDVSNVGCTEEGQSTN
jgi:hypothetical protein